MQTVLKILLAIALGIGFMALNTHAKPSLAFLGLTHDSDPQVRDQLKSQIQFELAADTGLNSFSKAEITSLFSKGVLEEPEISASDIPRLTKGLDAEFYAYAKLEPMAWVSKRVWWKPWSLKVKWSQGLHLRIFEASSGLAIYDGMVAGQLDEIAFLKEPDPWERLSPLEKNRYLNRLVSAISLETAKVISKTVKEKATPSEVAGAN
jgi:hypothetical protein